MPSGFVLEREKIPSARELNRLLSQCDEKTHSPKSLTIAMEKSICCLSIFEVNSGKLVGFVRATSDHGLNANLWNLVAHPGEIQAQLIAVLVHNVLLILRREMPGCSISVAAPTFAFKSLEENGFLLDPNGIRAMGIRLR